MMIGERNHTHPIVHVPPWPTSFTDNQVADISFTLSPNANAHSSPIFDDYSFCLQNDSFTALQRYLPSNVKSNLSDLVPEDLDSEFGKDLDLPVDAYSCDHFRMFEFKVRKCMRGRSHDWTECPYAHPGEKARRRDPRKYHYSGSACPDFRKGSCKKGDACDFAHGVFECWLHPARYRTQPCKDGLNCRRRVCFFAHSPEQLRVLSPLADSYDGSPHRLAVEGSFVKALQFISSPEPGSPPPPESPPMSPMASTSMNSLSRSLGSNSVNEIMASLRQLQLNKVQSMPSSWAFQRGGSGSGAPRVDMTRPGFCSLPSTPTHTVTRNGMGYYDTWDKGGCEEEPVMERVESGKDLRAKIFQKLSKENPLDCGDPNPPDAPNQDVEWVSKLIQ